MFSLAPNSIDILPFALDTATSPGTTSSSNTTTLNSTAPADDRKTLCTSLGAPSYENATFCGLSPGRSEDRMAVRPRNTFTR